MQKREEYFQGIRGICIICVILIHCMIGLQFKNNFKLAFNYNYWLIVRQFVNFPVATFIFLAGYFTNIDKVTNNTLEYFRNRAVRLIVPYFIWTILYGLINFLLGTKFNIKLIMKYLLFGGASCQLYFIIVLIQLTFITPIIVKCINKRWCNCMCLLITPIYLILVYIFNFKMKSQMPYYEVLFFPWFIFYYIGIYLKMRRVKEIVLFKSNKVLYSFFLTNILLLLSCFECYFLISQGQTEGFAVSQIKISSFLFSLSMINIFLVLQEYDSGVGKIIVEFGNNSFGIYFIHLFYIICLNKLLSYISFLENMLILYQLIQVILTLLFSYLTIRLIKRIFGTELSKLIFGF